MEKFMTTQATPEVKKTLTVVDRSTKALATAAEAVQKAITDLGSITTISTALAQEIEFKQSELNGLTDLYQTKEREQVAELRLRVKENEDKVFEELLKARKLIAVAPTVLTDLQTQLNQVTASAEANVTEAVKAAEARVSASAQAAMNAKEAAHQVEIATLKASTSSLTERNTFLTAQIAQLQNEIQKERDARVQIAQAEAAKQGVVVNAGK